MGATSGKDDLLDFPHLPELVDEQEIATDMALPIVFPFAVKSMIEVFSGQRIAAYQQQHGCFQTIQIVAARLTEPLPVL